MYSCGIAKRETIVTKGNTSWKGFDTVQVCRFDQRYTDMHQKLGCAGCVKDWDYAYLRKQGLLK